MVFPLESNMKRTIITLLLVFCLFPLAAIQFNTDLNFEYSYDTNAFSSPLPQYAEDSWLEWRYEYPFEKRHSIGANINSSLYMNKDSRVGLSLGLSMKCPVHATSIRPIPHDGSNYAKGWDYIPDIDTANKKIALFGAIGPIFRAKLGCVDLGTSIRLSIGGYDYKDSEVILGVQAQPFVNVFVTDHVYINISFNYDAHLMKFISHDVKSFEENYQMLSVASSLGIGFYF